jgi:molecular chaperone GrpE
MSEHKPESGDPNGEDAAALDAAAEVAAFAGDREEDNDAEELQIQLAESQDRLLRLQAELDNVRKRTSRELVDERKYASLPLARDLLPVIDNLHRAIEAAEQKHDLESLLSGVKLMEQQLKSLLTAHQCVLIEALEQPFDPNLHEAIQQMPSAEHPPGTVVLVTQPGYRLHDRVVRPSQVIVSKAAEESE